MTTEDYTRGDVENRRRFLKTALTSLVLAGLPGCHKDNREQIAVNPFMFDFLERSRQNSDRVSDDPKRLAALVRHARIYRPAEDLVPSQVPEELLIKAHRELSEVYPGSRICGIKRTGLVIDEMDSRILNPYMTFVRDILSFARNHPALRILQHPNLEFILNKIKEPSNNGRVPVYVGIAPINQYAIATEDPSGAKGKTSIVNVRERIGCVDGVLNFRKDGEVARYEEKSPTVCLSTLGSRDYDILLSPLSEYLVLALRESIQKHAQVFEDLFRKDQKLKGIPLLSLRNICVRIARSIEAITEAGSAVITAEYLRQTHIAPYAPKGIQRRIAEHANGGITEMGEIYGLVPCCYGLAIEEGLDTLIGVGLESPHLVESFVEQRLKQRSQGVKIALNR